MIYPINYWVMSFGGMNTLNKFFRGATALSVTLGLVGAFGLVKPLPVQAATAPSLGTAASFAVLADTAISDAAPTGVITGDVGLGPTSGGASITGLTSAQVSGTIYAMDAAGPDAGAGNNPTLIGTAKSDLTAAYTNAAGQGGAVAVVASNTDSFSGTGYTLAPGVYNSGSTMGITGALTLNGSATDVWVFQAGSTLTTAAASSIVLTGGAQACNVFWQVGSSATLGTTTAFKGNILAFSSITDNGGSTIAGRLLARNGAVSLNDTDVAIATCAASSGGTGAFTGTINVVKLVINDNGGTKIDTAFSLFLNNTQVLSGATTRLPANSTQYTVTETGNAGYTSSFSGDCDANGVMYLHAAENLFCILTNNDIGPAVVVPPVPPLIDVVKVPSPLSLPSGPGSVLYTYTTRNIGTVPMTNVALVGDTCSPIVLQSGDTDGDNQLDVTETWIFTCTTTLTATHTNTVVATGWANGLSATDIASATVIVGIPVVPPLIHLTKVPSPLALTAGGGMVTYTERISNPGIVPLSNVTLVDDKCSPMAYMSGDTNGDSLLQPSETWTYTCRSNLTATTTNTAIATGQGNGYTVRDVAIATVVVAAAVPALPNTGFGSTEMNIMWALLAAGASFGSLFFIYRKKQNA